MEKDLFQELLADKLKNLESPVRPEVWNSIASSLPAAGSAVASTGLSWVVKGIIGLSGVAVVAGGVYWATMDAVDDKKKDVNTTKNVQLVNDSSDEAKDLANDNESSDGSTNLEVNQKGTEQIVALENKANLPDEGIVTPPIQQPLLPVQEVPSKPLNTVTGLVPANPIKVEESPSSTVIVENPTVPETNTEETSYVAITKLPNAFSPNGDGLEDVFFIQSESLTDFVLVIMNQKNEIVFQTEDPNFRWNGMDSSGSYVEKGRYVYLITAYDKNGKFVKEMKSLTIIR